jgi:CRP/FNR family cyclic AMP-dependent transcriptional regulator
LDVASLGETSSPVVEQLKASSLLHDLPEAELEQLSARIHRSHYATNEFIFRKNDEGGSLMVVVSGRVKIISVSRSGAEVLLNIIERGEVFGEMALLDGKPRSADAVAASETELISLHRRDYLPILNRSPEAVDQMMSILCKRIRQTSAFVEDAVFLDASARLLRRMRTLAEQYGRPAPDRVGVRIQHGLSQQELGESVGLTRVSINRHLAAWRERGLIKDGRGYIIVPDMAKLEAAVRDD